MNPDLINNLNQTQQYTLPLSTLPNVSPESKTIAVLISDNKASFLRRYTAWVLDIFFITIFSALLGLLLYYTFNELLVFIFIPVILTIWYLYSVITLFKFGATIGKKLMRLSVVSKDNHSISLFKVCIREGLGKVISYLFFCLGFFWIVIDKNKQAWHDKIAGTFVLSLSHTEGKDNKFLLIPLFLLSFIVLLAPVIMFSLFLIFTFDPLERNKVGRDITRIADLQTTNQLINLKIEASSNSGTILCKQNSVDCRYSITSVDGIKDINGSGWIQIDLTDVNNEGNLLPVDPINDGRYFYRYCSDGKDWEINTRLESQKLAYKATNDQGDTAQLYEIGSKLTLCFNN